MNDTPIAHALPASLLAAAIPTLAYTLLVWRIDRYEREPLRLVLAAFLWGAVPAAIGAVVLSTILSLPLASLSEEAYELATASLVAPPVEEALKALALLGLYRWARHEFDDALDGIVYGSLVGFGFAMTENVLYFMGSRDSASQFAAVVLGRAVAFGFNHAMFTSFTGAAFGLAISVHGQAKRLLIVLAGLSVAIGAHLAHNLLLTTADVCLPSLVIDWAGVMVVLAIVLASWSRERQVIQRELTPEVAAGVLTAEQLEDIGQRRKQMRRTWRSMGAKGIGEARRWRQLMDSAVELAFALRRQRRERPASPERVLNLRRQVLQRRQALGDERAVGQVACPTCGRPLEEADACPHCGMQA